MRVFAPRYIISLLIGIFVGVIFSDFWAIITITMTAIIALITSTIVHRYGGGYKYILHFLWTGPILTCFLGILLGIEYVG